MNVDISKFDIYVGFYDSTTSTSSSGTVARTYSLSKSVWANIDTRSANEQFVADKRNSANIITINIRKDSSMVVNSTWRFEVDGITYQVTGVVENTNFPRGEVLRISGEVIK